MNNITIKGNVGKEPVLSYSSSGDAMLKFSVADSKRRKNQNSGEWETVNTTWWRITVWRDKAEALANTLGRGTLVIVSGRALLREYDKDDGSKGYALEVDHADVAVVPRLDAPAAVPAAAVSDPWESAQGNDPNKPPF